MSKQFNSIKKYKIVVFVTVVLAIAAMITGAMFESIIELSLLQTHSFVTMVSVDFQTSFKSTILTV